MGDQGSFLASQSGSIKPDQNEEIRSMVQRSVDLPVPNAGIGGGIEWERKTQSPLVLFQLGKAQLNKPAPRWFNRPYTLIAREHIAAMKKDIAGANQATSQ